MNGKKYGAAAVDKFSGAIQLGVTATPEYSEDNTVAKKLAHRYYNLPLNTAIERGDLCPVRPMLIQTKLAGNDKINLKRAKEFIEKRHGRPMSERELSALYNLKARNKTIIKAYLTGVHPETKERYLGQTGMIFAGGIDHIEDFVRDAADVLNEPKYREIKNWLRDEGLALAAPLHSEMPKEGVDIILGGRKTRCSEDQIKELHRQGRVLLIVSDKKLALGSNFPRDSFIADAVDRFTVPDAAQRIGRGFRVDRPNLRYHHPGNPGKSCVVFNVIDETTHEMYKDTPHHPIHAIELLQGAVHRPPMRRIAALSRFRKPPPEVEETMEQQGFEFIHRIEEIRRVAKKFEEAKDKKLLLPTKDEYWLSSYDTMNSNNVLGGGRRSVRKAVLDLTGKSSTYDSKKLGIQTIKYNGQSIDLQKMQSYKKQAICIRRAHWNRVEKAAGMEPSAILPIKDEHWLSSRDPENSDIVPGGNRRPIKKAVQDLTGKFSPYDSKKLGIQTVKYNGQSIDLQKMQTGNTQSICIRRAHWDRVEKAAGVEPSGILPDKDEHWLSSPDSKNSDNVPGGQRPLVEKAVQDLIGKSSSYDSKKLGIQTVKYNGQSIDLQKMQSGTKQPICIRRTHWDRVERAAGVEVLSVTANLQSKPVTSDSAANGSKQPDKSVDAPDGWLSAAGLSNAGYKGTIAELDEKILNFSFAENDRCMRRGMDEDGATAFVMDKYVCPYGLDDNNPDGIWHISPEGRTKMEAQGLLTKKSPDITPTSYVQRDSLKSTPVTQKSIAPGSNHLKSTGRGRGRNDEG